MEYNTQREQLKITDYGRHVAKLIDYCKTIGDRDERTQFAQTIVEVMGHVNPKVKERTDYKHILWDHLMMLADYDLDVDCPYETGRADGAAFSPKPLHYSEGRITFPHYGRTLEEMVRAVAEMPESEERTLLTTQIAHTMKRQYLQWNRDTVDDQLIVDQLDQLSGGRLRLPEGFEFKDSKVYTDAMAAAATKKEGGRKKRKKKK